jgi:hypothetical protein
MVSLVYPSGEEGWGVISSFKWFLPVLSVFTTSIGGGGGGGVEESAPRGEFSAYIQLLYSFTIFPGKFVLMFVVLRNLSVGTVHRALLHTVVYGTHSGWCRWERRKVSGELEHKVFCLVWLVLNEVLVKKAENDSCYCFSWLRMSTCHMTSISVITFMYIHNCVPIIFNMVHHNYIVLFSTLCCPLDAGFHFWENAVEELELLSGQKFSHRKWRKPCISTFKRTQQNISQRWSRVRLWASQCIPPPWAEPDIELMCASQSLQVRAQSHFRG